MAVRTLTIDTNGEVTDNNFTTILNSIEISNAECINFWGGDWYHTTNGPKQIDVVKPGSTSTLKFENRTFNIKVSNKTPNISLDTDNGYEIFFIIEPSNPTIKGTLYLYGKEAVNGIDTRYETICIVGSWPATKYAYMPSGNYKRIACGTNTVNKTPVYNIAPRDGYDMNKLGTAWGAILSELSEGHTIDSILGLADNMTNKGTINTLNCVELHNKYIKNCGVIDNVINGLIIGGESGTINNVTGQCVVKSVTTLKIGNITGTITIWWGSTNITINNVTGTLTSGHGSNINVDTLSGTGTYFYLYGPATINTITATGTLYAGEKNHAPNTAKITIKNLYGKIVRSHNMDFEIENAYKGSVITDYRNNPNDSSFYTGITTIKNDYR